MGNTETIKFFVDNEGELGNVGIGLGADKQITSHVKESMYTYTALYNYDARRRNELTYKKGETIEILNSKKEERWFARSTESNKKGYVTSNFIAPTEAVDADWYFGKMERSDAEMLLLAPNLASGTFIIRDCYRKYPRRFALSVRDHNIMRVGCVHHYSVEREDNSGYHISSNERQFTTLTKLLDFYTQDAGGLCCKLEMPVPKVTRTQTLTNRETLEIGISSVQFISRVKNGTYADIWKGTWKEERIVAIKIFKKGTKSQSAFIEEANIMKLVVHAHVVQLVYAKCSENPCIILEYMGNGNLLDYLKGDGDSIATTDLLKIAAQISNGMANLETMNVVHRDLRASNVLVNRHWKWKISDFGLARKLDDNGCTTDTESKPSIRWTAPEGFDGLFTVKSDVWSFGVVLFELITYGKLPYEDKTNRECVDALRDGYILPRPSDCPEPLYRLMCDCWRKEPDDRPPFQSVYQLVDNYYGTADPE